MGNWTILIEGTGSHHNNKSETDADIQFEEFVKKLKESGQNIEHATFTNGARESV